MTTAETERRCALAVCDMPLDPDWSYRFCSRQCQSDYALALNLEFATVNVAPQTASAPLAAEVRPDPSPSEHRAGSVESPACQWCSRMIPEHRLHGSAPAKWCGPQCKKAAYNHRRGYTPPGR